MICGPNLTQKYVYKHKASNRRGNSIPVARLNPYSAYVGQTEHVRTNQFANRATNKKQGFSLLGTAGMRERKTMIQELQRKRKSPSVKTNQKLYTSAPACPHVTKLAAKMISVKLLSSPRISSSLHHGRKNGN